MSTTMLTLREVRDFMNCTQEDIADLIGMPQSSISQEELGKTALPAGKRKELEDYFGKIKWIAPKRTKTYCSRNRKSNPIIPITKEDGSSVSLVKTSDMLQRVEEIEKQLREMWECIVAMQDEEENQRNYLNSVYARSKRLEEQYKMLEERLRKMEENSTMVSTGKDESGKGYILFENVLLTGKDI